MRRFFLVFGLGAILASAFVTPVLAQSHPAHEHGAAKLDVSIFENVVELSLDSPLINFISFERAPNSPAETEEVKKMGQILGAATTVFVFPKEAGCQVKGVRIDSEPLDPALLPTPVWPADRDHGEADHDRDSKDADHDHGPEDADHNHDSKDTDHDHGPEDADHDHGHGEEDDHDHDHGEHGDIVAEYLFECQKPAALKEINVRLFDKFPSLSRIDARIVTESAQKSATLDGRNALIQW
jgi:hypothetical protein